MIYLCRFSAALLLAISLTALSAALPAGESYPVEPATFFPAGMLGLQIGNSWEAAKKSPLLDQLICQPGGTNSEVFDEVCFFKTSSRISGAPIRDGFIVGKGDRMVLIGTGIAIRNPDDPVAEKVMRDFESQIHAKFQQAGPDVLFVNLPEKRMSAAELRGFSQTAPVLLVELEPKENELAVFYGYLAPVNAFSAMTAD
ncbi:MAG: hypothetical protein M3N97_06460 [Pseudomonadota bacterium]|nr:hypothetical protein [Pseudomonadota bacterium]